MIRRARSLARAVLLAACLGFALAGGWGGGGTTPTDPDPDPTPTDPIPSSWQYQAGLERSSFADAYYEVYRCSQPVPGVYTTLQAMASTSSGSYKSSDLAHNVRLYANGLLRARSADVSRSVSGASASNFITSLNPVSVGFSMSCPEAFLVTVEARGWHKGNSIHGYSHSFYTSDFFSG